MSNNKQTAVEWLVEQNDQSNTHHTIRIPSEYVEKAKEMERHQQDTFAIDFAEWYEKDVLAKGDYEMIDKDKKELLEIFKETYEQQ